MRAKGYSFQSIADTLGYSDASGASKAYHRALRRRPAQNVDEIRAQESDRLEFCWRKTAEVIERPPLVHSAIGKTVPDPRSPGDYLVDESTRIRAITEYRHLSESYRKLCGADIVVKDPTAEDQAALDEAMRYLTELSTRCKSLEVENLALRTQVAQWENGQLQRAQIAA
jgi:hypothetical protein